MKTSRKKNILGAGLILLLTLAAYIPAISDGYIWDDNAHITDNLTLRTVEGLGRICFDVETVPQYYPLVHTFFWLEYHLWQLHPLGYHLVNVLLHGLSGVLLWLVLHYLSVPGAWLAAAVFALPPVQVESAAWITERKNVLSGFFYLASLLTYLHLYSFEGKTQDTFSLRGHSPDSTGLRPRWLIYLISLFLFLCALLSKTVTCSMPVAILLILWWKRNRIGKTDLLALIPHFVMGNLPLRKGRTDEAIVRYQEAWRLGDNSPTVLNNLAWLFATHKNPKFRDGEKAVQLAAKACLLTDQSNATYLDTLAAAYAELGRFDEAVQTAQKAVELGRASGQSSLAEDMVNKILFYRAGKAFYEG